MNTGASTLYIGEERARKLGTKTMRITSPKVRVADNGIVTTTGISTVQIKLHGLAPETTKVYALPLHKIDLIIGLPCCRNMPLISIS